MEREVMKHKIKKTSHGGFQERKDGMKQAIRKVANPKIKVENKSLMDILSDSRDKEQVNVTKVGKMEE